MKESEYTKLFKSMVEAKGWIFEKSNKDTDMHQHIDCYVTVTSSGRAIRTIAVELKGDKYNHRRNNGIKDCLCQYVEFFNVRGDRGWLFGDAEFIVILNEEENGFYWVERTKLISAIEKMLTIKLNGSLAEIRRRLDSVGCEKNLWVGNGAAPENRMHRLYRRHDRPDECVYQINYTDVKNNAKMTW